jgi:hypothetical protein
MMIFDEPAAAAAQSSFGSEFDVLDLSYVEQSGEQGWLINDFTATYTFYNAPGGVPDVGCVHYKK